MKTDINGNELTITTQSCSSSSIRTNILLKRKNESTPSEIGYIINDLKLLILKRIRSRDSINNCYAFNHHLMSEGKSFDWIQLSDDYGVYKFRKEFLLQNGKLLDDGAMGFDVQILLPVYGIEQCKIGKPPAKSEVKKTNKKRTVIIDKTSHALFDLDES